MATTFYSPTEYGEGSCSENEYRNMWAKMAQLGTRHAVKLLEYQWDDDNDSRIFSPGSLTVEELNGMFDDFFHCYCDYWTGPGDVFPLVKSKMKQYKLDEDEDYEPDDGWGVEIANAGRLGMQSAKTCHSNNCRRLFDSVFAMVDKLSGTSLTQGITHNGAPACAAAHAEKCWGGNCWPIDREPRELPAADALECNVCYAPSEPSSTLYPMKHMDDHADRIIFWSSCSMSTDCPPAEVSSYQLKFTLTTSTSLEDFDTAKQEAFKTRVASLLNQESGLEAPGGTGAVSANDVTLIISGSEVEVVINVYSETVKTRAITTLDALAKNPSTASSKLGTALLTIIDVGAVSVVNVGFAPPSPPPAGDTDELSDAALAGIIVGTLVGLCCCFLGCALAFLFYQKLQKQKGSEPTKGISDMGSARFGANKSTPPSSAAAVTVEMKNPVALKLQKLDLEQYASALVDEQGYDSLASLEGLTKEQAGEIADAVKMKPGHKKRFIDGIA